MKTTRDRDCFINGDRGASSSENTKEKPHREVKTNTVNINPDTFYPFHILTSSSENGELEPKGHKSKVRINIDLDSDINNEIDILRRNANVTNTIQHDRENMDCSVALSDQKKEMINDTNTNHINCKINPRSFSKLKKEKT